MGSNLQLGSGVHEQSHRLCGAQATPLFDKLVFSKIKARLGGRVNLILSGGAPLAGHVEEFLKVGFRAATLQHAPALSVWPVCPKIKARLGRVSPSSSAAPHRWLAMWKNI